ncbi:zinc ABC transporter substrate-binding protein [Microbacterium sp.]|uniref:metal ABC transporter solute-binding protein, Zn/Mn family n=1 Tax=Microbacterium sp. TaxID=51671 RepID=UPI00260ED962|nr:zinc ABC transporter substrate-binding protein [Microbacterium sp.]
MQKLRAAALLSASALILAGCSTAAGGGEADDGRIRVTASTNVYGSLAEQIGGDRVEVTSIITSARQDPHSYEASARDRLTVQDADLVIKNGGGYDAFVDTLLDGSDAHVLTAVEFSHDFPDSEGHDDEHEHDDADEHADEHADADADADEHADEEHAEHDEHADHDHAEDEHDEHAGHDHIEGFNEHVWFDPHTMIHVVEGISDELSEIDPDGAAEFTASADEIIAELEGFEADLETLSTEANGAAVFITEPLPGYIAAAAGLEDVTPKGFAEAVEEGNDVAPATLLDALEVIDSGDVAVLLTNAQTGGAETQRVEEAAEAAGIPVVAFTELLEDGSSYAEWMRDAIQNLADALDS